MPSPASNGNMGPETSVPQKHPSTRKGPAGELKGVPNSHSSESLNRSSELAQASLDSAAQIRSDVAVPQLVVSQQLDYAQKHPSFGHAKREEVASRDGPDGTALRPETNDTMAPKNAKGVHESPLLTGKDSAYSSISGGSFASPTAVPPRSASAQSSYPRAQFGLFPTSAPSTPKHSVSGRHGALSPALASPRYPDPPPPPPQRSQSALDSHAPARRLTRKSSLSSFKKLFTKKKSGSVETIAE